MEPRSRSPAKDTAGPGVEAETTGMGRGRRPSGGTNAVGLMSDTCGYRSTRPERGNGGLGAARRGEGPPSERCPDRRLVIVVIPKVCGLTFLWHRNIQLLLLPVFYHHWPWPWPQPGLALASYTTGFGLGLMHQWPWPWPQALNQVWPWPCTPAGSWQHTFIISSLCSFSPQLTIFIYSLQVTGQTPQFTNSTFHVFIANTLQFVLQQNVFIYVCISP